MTLLDIHSSPAASSISVTATSSPRSSLSTSKSPKDWVGSRRRSSLDHIAEAKTFQNYNEQLVRSPLLLKTDNNNNDITPILPAISSPKSRRGSECGSLGALKADQTSNESKRSSRRMSLPNLNNQNSIQTPTTIEYNNDIDRRSRRHSLSIAPDSPTTPQSPHHRRSISSNTDTLSPKSVRRLSIRDLPNERGSVSRRASLVGLALPDKSWCDFTSEVTPSVWKNYVQNWEDERLSSKQIFLLSNDLYLFYKEQYTTITRKQNPRFADNQVEAAVERHLKLTFAGKDTRYEQTLSIEKLILSELCKPGERFVDKHTFYTKWPHFVNDHFNVAIQTSKNDMKCTIM